MSSTAAGGSALANGKPPPSAEPPPSEPDFSLDTRRAQLVTSPMRYLVISCSLNPESRSRILAQIAHKHLAQHGLPVEFLDLRELELPICDGAAAYSHPSVTALGPRIEEARGIILATAIYNYDVNAAAKNLIELTGSAWKDKVVGFVCAAGGQGSYMSVMPFANSLMLDYRCLVIPRFVYSPSAPIDDRTFGDKAINKRIEELTVELVRVSDALLPAGKTDGGASADATR